jgi:hypothetical protein
MQGESRFERGSAESGQPVVDLRRTRSVSKSRTLGKVAGHLYAGLAPYAFGGPHTRSVLPRSRTLNVRLLTAEPEKHHRDLLTA